MESSMLTRLNSDVVNTFLRYTFAYLLSKV